MRLLLSLPALAAPAAPAAALPHQEAAEPSAAALAQLPLDALLNLPVSGASRVARSMSESPASVTVIGADEIRALGHATLAEVLASMRGVMITSDRMYSYAGVRGFFSPGDYNTRILLLVDGNRINDAVYDQAYLGTEFPLDLDEVERIEFIPGQGSAVYGANALFGVVNVVTRSAHASAGQSRAGVRLGTGAQREVHAAFSRRVGEGALRLGMSRELVRGQGVVEPALANPAHPDGRADGVDGSDRTALRLRYEQGPWTMNLVHADRVKGVPFYPGLVFGDSRNRYRDTHTLVDAEWQQALGANLQGTVHLWHGQYRFDGDYVIDYPPPTQNRDVGAGRWWGVEARLLGTAWAGHRLLVGGKWQQAPRLAQRNFDLDAAQTVYLDDRRRNQRAALFAEDLVALAPTLTASVGARLDRQSGQDMRSSPRLGLIYRPAPEWVAKAVVGSAFRPPNAYEAHYVVDGAGGYLPNPNLQPERVHGRELAVEWSPAPRTRLATAWFRNRATGLLALRYDPAADRYQFFNTGELTARGVETEVQTRWPGGMALRANLTWQHTRSSGMADPRPQFPQRMAKLAVVQPWAGRWTGGLEVQAMSRRDPVGGQTLLNATAATQRRPHAWDFSLSVRNLLDRRLQDPGFDPVNLPAIVQPGRQWRLAVERGF